MSYQALMFCPDEKTARVVTQVLTELDFNVDPCNEPFAAVKKLTTQHFDAVVVDCDNEQNAGLLFKSARNSPLNQSSLAVAVVEGQAGVAKAFRIGANLVLTKPINVDQAKGTLRVARGLLKKTDPGKPAASMPTAPSASPSMPASAAPPVRAVTPAPAARTFTPAAPKTTFAPPVPKAPAAPPMAVASTASLELEDEPVAEADIDEDMSVEPVQQPALAKKFVPPAQNTRAKEYPWQPVSKPAGSMASSLKRAADVVAQASHEAPEAEGDVPHEPASFAAPETHSFSPAASAAAAPARAKIPPRVTKPAQAKPIAHVEATPKSAPAPTKLSITDPLAEEGVAVAEHAHAPVAPPKLATAPSGSAMKIGVIAAVAVIVLAAGYLGLTKLQLKPSKSAPASSQVAATAPAPVAAQNSEPSSSAETKPTAAGEVKHSPETASAAVHTDKAQKSEPEKTAAKTKTSAPEQKSEEAQEDTPAPILVKNGVAKPAAAAVQAPIEAPSPDALMASGTGAKAISGIVDSVGVVVPKAGQTLRVSQGVMRGMLIKQVQPSYPAQAQRMRLQGAVQLEATIAKDGHVANVKQTSGNEVLGHAAIQAVRQWRYKPYVVSGQPIEIQTQISLDFKLP